MALQLSKRVQLIKISWLFHFQYTDPQKHDVKYKWKYLSHWSAAFPEAMWHILCWFVF